MRQGPMAAAAVNPAVPQQEGKQLLALAAKIVSRRLAGPHKIAHGLVSGVRRPHARQFAGPMQPRQRDRIPSIRFDPLARPFRNQGRSDDKAVMTESLDLAIKPISRWSGFKANMQPVVSICQSLDRPLDRQRAVLDVAEKPDFSVRPPSAIATACFFLATSKATKTSLYFPMVRPPCMRLGSACPSNPRSYLHERAGHRRRPANMTSSVYSRLFFESGLINGL